MIIVFCLKGHTRICKVGKMLSGVRNMSRRPMQLSCKVVVGKGKYSAFFNHVGRWQQ